jgi:nicotinate dehydrogenase subunit B
VFGWKPVIASISRLDPSLYSAATVARGARLAAAGDCVVCHTAPGGVPNTGGRGMETPFGTVYTTNLTPDPATGIGNWSFSAFQRAMREGISRDGRHLYPAFPYPSFTRMTDDDLSALYAWLMSQPAVHAEVPRTRLPFPFSMRPLMALWNARYLDPGPMLADPARSPEWNRGAYLVNGLGHCGACHTPRNALGAEREGAGWLAGAMIEGWEAPALAAPGPAPVPWTEAQFFRYLSTGYTEHHGSAAGPMTAVVQQFATVPESDVRAIAHYLASFQQRGGEDQALVLAAAAIDLARTQATALTGEAQRLFEGACGACHHDGEAPVQTGRNLPLALSSKLHSARPDNLVRVILEGIRTPASGNIGFMPAFADSLDDRQVVELVAWMRQRFAPQQAPWPDLASQVARLRER